MCVHCMPTETQTHHLNEETDEVTLSLQTIIITLLCRLNHLLNLYLKCKNFYRPFQKLQCTRVCKCVPGSKQTNRHTHTLIFDVNILIFEVENYPQKQIFNWETISLCATGSCVLILVDISE